MINNRQLLFICTAILFLAVSCQKKYERPDVVIGTGTTGGGTTGGGTTGALVIKAEANTPGSTEASVTTYDYDANNRLIKITSLVTDSFSQSRSVMYRFVRDATGKVTKIVSDVFSASAGSGLADSVYFDVHYPTGSSNFDFTRFTLTLSGLVYVDSIAFTYSNGLVASRSEYAGFAAAGPLTQASRTIFEYSNGNLVTEKSYASAVATTPTATFVIEYDTKNAALSTGNEAFLPGQSEGSASKNNPIRETVTDNSNGSIALLVNYTLQYNAGNYPITGVLVESKPGSKTQNLKFTYR